MSDILIFLVLAFFGAGMAAFALCRVGALHLCFLEKKVERQAGAHRNEHRPQ